MKSEPSEPDKKSYYVGGIAGGLSNIIPRCIIQPLDVLKIRFQLQVEPISKSDSSYYRSINQAALRILKEEGVSAFWKGHIPAQVLSCVYGSIQFFTFEHLKSLGSGSQSFGEDFIFGGFAGIAATVCSCPLDVLRTRFVAQGNTKIYSNLVDSIRQIWLQDNYRGFFRGLTPACLLIYPQTAIQFSTYHLLRNEQSKSEDRIVWLSNLTAGATAGFISKAIVYPMDVAKKRLQIQNFEAARRPFGKFHQTNGFTRCMADIVRNEGFMGLYKGWLVSCMKTSLYSAAVFTSYELFKRALTH